jgi:predicted DNA-binding transcriptional regulator AlpA
MHMHTNTDTQTTPVDSLLSLQDFASRLGVHRNTAAKLRKNDPAFPVAVEILPGVERFRSSECQAYIESRPRVERSTAPNVREKFSALSHRGWEQRRARLSAGACATA